MKNYAFSISAFFPVYNDEKTVELITFKLMKVLPTICSDYEIIIINDGSIDKSGKIADDMAKKFKCVKVIHHNKNLGYGGALKSGFKASKKSLIFYTDGDAQYDVNELKNLYAHINDCDVVSGRKIKRADKFYRIILSKMYYFILRKMFSLKVKDVSGDFRLFKRKVIDSIDLKSDSGTICLEMIKKIELKGFKIKEVLVHHYPRSGDSQYFNMKGICQTFKEIAPLWYELVLKKIFRKYIKQ